MPEAKVQVMQLDLASFSSISSFANKFKHLQLPLHILVNNAYVLLKYIYIFFQTIFFHSFLNFIISGVMGCPHKKTEDGFEMQMGTNHIGNFYLSIFSKNLFRNIIITCISK